MSDTEPTGTATPPTAPAAADAPAGAPEGQLPGSGLWNHIKNMGYVGERKAVALAALGFFTTFLFLITINIREQIPEWYPAFCALFATYALTFFGLAAEWFWGRWVATGLAYWGMTVAVMAMVTTRQMPMALIIFGIGHALIFACVQGPKMALVYELKPDWRKRWGIDDDGARKLRASVTRAASSVPALILFALAPRESAGAGLTLLALATGGFALLLAGRTLGALLIGWAGLATLAAGTIEVATNGPQAMTVAYGVPVGPTMAFYAGALLLASIAPLVRPAIRYLRKLP